MSDQKNNQRNNNGSCVDYWDLYAILALITIPIVQYFLPNVISFRFLEFWTLKRSILEAIIISWPLFAWIITVNFIIALMKRNSPEINRKAELILLGGFLKSLQASVTEEISFRWLIFFGFIPVCKGLNWLTFSWAGLGIVEFLQLNFLGPIANYLSLGLLETFLLNEVLWAEGAAIIAANAFFSIIHRNRNLLNVISAWFTGLFFFYLTFTYGLIAAIVVHFLFDMLAYAVIYADAAVERMAA